MDINLNALGTKINARIKTLENLALSLYFLTINSAKSGNSSIALTSNKYLGEILTNLADHQILKGIVSSAHGYSDVQDTCMYNALIVNPNAGIRDSYTIVYFQVGISEEVSPTAVFARETITVALSNKGVQEYLLASMKKLMGDSPEIAKLDLCRDTIYD